MSTTPEDTQGHQGTEPLIDEVLEALDRSLTKLRRRTRDVLNLGRERDALIAAINNGGVPALEETPSSIGTVDSAAIHGESSATDPSQPPAGITDTFVEEQHDIAAPTEVAPQDAPVDDLITEDHIAVDDLTDIVDKEPEDIPVAETEVEDDTADEPWEEAATSFDPGELTPLEAPEPNLSWVAENDADLHDELSDTADPIDEQLPADEATIPTAPSWESDAASANAPLEAESAPTREAESADDGWSSGWSEDNDTLPDAPGHTDEEPVNAILEVDLESGFAVPANNEFEDTDVDRAKADSDEFGLPKVELSNQDADSPFASQFEEHVEDLGGTLPASPFDLDTPPEPASYRPRAFQSDELDTVAAADLLAEDPRVDEADWARDATPSNASAGHAESAPAVDTAATQGPSTGSRLRDLVSQAQQAERERTAEALSDFELIRDEPAVSRYNKNSAKLPRSGISSEELSSSVANLRSSLSPDKKSAPADRNDQQDPKRVDRKAEKRAAKEAAKAAKAETKRQRKQR